MWECRTIARSPTSSRMTDREEVEGPLQIALRRDLEVRGGDGCDEAGVEGLRDAQRGVDAVPAEAQRELVDAQLAGVVDAEGLHPREMPLEQGPELPERVFAQVPRVIGLLGAWGREREPVRGRDVGEWRRGREAPQQGRGLVDVLDRLQEDDRVAGLVELLDQPTLEAQVRA